MNAPRADLNEADRSSQVIQRVGGVIVIALVPALIGASGGRSLGPALAHGYQPAMIVMGGLSVAAALVTGLFVSDDRTAAPPRAPSPRVHGCALPVSDQAGTP